MPIPAGRRPYLTPYIKWVRRVRHQLERLTDSTVFYVDQTHLASYCPACRHGTLRIGFFERPQPGFVIDSQAGPGQCSYGCTEQTVMEAMRA